MDRRDIPKSCDEQLMEQILSGLQELLLSSPEEDSNRQDPENNLEVSEYDLIDPEVAAAELNHVLGHLPSQHNRPNNEDCPVIWKYFNLTMQIMEELHQEHLHKKPDAGKSSRLQPKTRPDNQPSSSSTDMRPTSLDYLFECPKCCPLVSMLYENFNSDQPSTSRQTDQTLPSHSNYHLNKPSLPYMWQTSIDAERPMADNKSETNIRPQRPSLSPVPNLPSTSRQGFFDHSVQLLSAEGRRSRSPLPNLPSTSRGYVYAGADQSFSPRGESIYPYNVPQQRRTTLEPHLYRYYSQTDIERKKKFLRIKKEKNMYQRNLRKK